MFFIDRGIGCSISRLNTTLLYALELVHALLVILDQRVYVTLELADFGKFAIEPHLEFGIGLTENFLTILLDNWPNRHHIELKGLGLILLTHLSEDNTWRGEIVHGTRSCLPLIIVFHNDLSLAKVTHLDGALVWLSNFVKI